MRNRGFEIVKGYENKGINLPVRKTKYAAAYDVEAAEDIVIPKYYPGIKPTLIPTGLKAYCMEDECYLLLNRSSGPKKGFIIANSVIMIIMEMNLMMDIFTLHILIAVIMILKLKKVMLLVK